MRLLSMVMVSECALGLSLSMSGGPARRSAPPLSQPAEPTLDARSARLLAPLSAVAAATATQLGLALPASAAIMTADSSTNRYFPGHMSSKDIDAMVWRSLAARGYSPTNTLFATSVCPDEVNANSGEMTEMMKKRWGEAFTLGGLAGVPFAGKAGLGAYAHHVPDEGKLLIVFAPHVGVGLSGQVGALERPGQGGTSNACGAGIGAYKAIAKNAAAGEGELKDLDDLQIGYIIKKLAPRMNKVADAPDPVAYVTYQMYNVVRDAMMNEIASVPGIWDDTSELAVLGGVMINRYDGGDRFQPLMFQTTTQNKDTTDLFPSTFGPLPDLSGVLASKIYADETVNAMV